MYEPLYEEETGGGGFLVGLLCGTALGAAIGLMFAPRAGSEIRRNLYDSTSDIRRKASDAYDQASEQVNTMVSKGKQAVDRGREAFENARQQSASQTTGNGGTESYSPSRPTTGV
jgi:gas vesicle protein